MIQNKQGLLNLVDRAERGVLLSGEAQILRDAIELLDEMVMSMDDLVKRGRATVPTHDDYEASTTQTFAAISEDDSPGAERRQYADHWDDRYHCP